MKVIRFTINTLATTIFIFTLAVAAQAQQRVFVSGTGDDLNPCTRTSPCRNFQRGHDVVAPGGDVVALDSAGYGQLTITKSVSIIGDGVHAGITASLGSGVAINTAGVTVNLRSLRIEGQGTGNNGISATDFTALHIENCIVKRFAGDGIRVDPSTPGTKKLFIKDSIIKDNAQNGIFLFHIGGTVLLTTVEGTRTENNVNFGIRLQGPGAIATVRGCLSSGNSMAGFQSEIGGVLNIESSVASNNGTFGVSAAQGNVRVSTSTITNNTSFGFSHSAATFESRGNNTVAGNNGGGAQTTGTITPLTAL